MGPGLWVGRGRGAADPPAPPPRPAPPARAAADYWRPWRTLARGRVGAGGLRVGRRKVGVSIGPCVLTRYVACTRSRASTDAGSGPRAARAGRLVARVRRPA